MNTNESQWELIMILLSLKIYNLGKLDASFRKKNISNRYSPLCQIQYECKLTVHFKSIRLQFLYLCLSICCITVIEVPGVTCQARADVGFIIDSSGSVRREYGKEKSFVKSLAYRFGLSAKGSHAGAVIFSHKAEVKVTFAEKNSITEFNDAIDNLPLLGYTTRIDKALRVAYNDLFQVRNGMRLGVPKVVFVLTDGKQTNEYDAVSPATAILPFHESDMKVIVIGVGSSVSKNELRSMAKSEKDVYFAKDFDELMSSEFVDKVIALSCQKGKG